MVKTAIRWVLVGGSFVAVGPLLALVWRCLVRAGDAGPSATMLVSATLIGGIIATLIAFAVAGALGVLTARLFGERVGYAAAGVCLAGPAWASGTMLDLLRWAPAPKAFWMLGVEGAIVGLFGVILALLIRAAADRRSASDGQPRTPDDRLVSAQGMLGACVGIAAGAAAAWLVARESTRGQTLAAGVVGAVAAATAARVAAMRCPLACVVAAMGALALISPIVVGVVQGSGALRAVYEQKLIGVGLLMPLDWVAGAFLGAPLGAAWAASMVDKRTAKAAHGAEMRA